MKRSAPDSVGGGGESGGGEGGDGGGQPDAKRARIAEAELRSVRAQLMALTEENADLTQENAAQAATLAEQVATLQALTPLPVLEVSAQSNFQGHATLTWDNQTGGGTPTHFLIGAIDATTGARHEDIAREEGGDAIGSIVVNAARSRWAGSYAFSSPRSLKVPMVSRFSAARRLSRVSRSRSTPRTLVLFHSTRSLCGRVTAPRSRS